MAAVLSRLNRTFIALVCVSLLSFPISAFATRTATLAWDPSPDATVAGYKIYYGVTSHGYTNTLSLGNTTNDVVTGLVEGTTYFFAATAYDTSGTESDFSNEISYSVPVTPGLLIGALPDQIVNENSATANISFVIGDTNNPSAVLTLSASSSNPTLVPVANISFGGSGSNRTVQVTPAANQTGTANITVTVAEGSLTASALFQLTVLATPPPPPPPSRAPSVLSVSNLPTSTYSGLFYEQNEVRLQSAGYFSLKVTSRGKYSGYIQSASGRYPFKGQFGSQCQATNLVPRKGTNGLVLDFYLGASDQTNQLVGHLSDGNWTSTVSGDRAVFNTKLNPAPYAGRYTLVLQRDAGSPVSTGNGFGTLLVGKNGIAKFAGTLADGTKVSQSAPISENGLWPLYASLYSGKGAIVSWVSFTNLASTDCDGVSSWIKLADSNAVFYPGGLTNYPAILGSLYVPPSPTSLIVNVTKPYLLFSGGNLTESFINKLVFWQNSKVTNLSSNQLSLGFALSTGLFKGSVADPVTGKLSPYSGAVLQKMNTGLGFLRGTNQSGQVIFSP